MPALAYRCDIPLISSVKKFLYISIALILFISLLLAAAPAYFQKALWYNLAGIDDYKIFENRVVPAGKPQPWPVGAAFNKKQLSTDYVEQVQDLETVAFVVVQNGKLQFEQYWDGYGEKSLSNSFSVTKSFVGLLIGAAIDDGKIRGVDQKVGEFIPEYAVGRNAQLTIKDVLTMSSGLNWDESYFNPFSVTTQAYYGDDLRSLVKSLEVIEIPGKRFKYLSGNTQVLAQVLERATGKTLANYASDKLWQPIGAAHDALWSVDKQDGEEKAYCCFNSNARDFARIGQLVLNQGKWNGKQLISESYIREAISPASYLTDGNGKPVDFYGYQWWIVRHNGYSIPYARGILGQYIFVIPEKNTVIVRLGKERSLDYRDNHPADVFLYIDAGLSMLE